MDEGWCSGTKGKLNDRDAKCPFFCCHLRQSIICESPIPDSRVKINFATQQGKALQYRVFCCGRFENCEIYKAVNEKYGEDD